MILNAHARCPRCDKNFTVQVEATPPEPVRDEANDSLSKRIWNRLSPREREVCALIAEGLRNLEIAGHIGTSEQTVKNHLRLVYEKTGAHDRLDLGIFILRHPLLHERLRPIAIAYGVCR